MALKNGYGPLEQVMHTFGTQESFCWRMPDGELVWQLPSLMVAPDDGHMSAVLFAFLALEGEPRFVTRMRIDILGADCGALPLEAALERYVSDSAVAAPSAESAVQNTKAALKYKHFVEMLGNGCDLFASRLFFGEHHLLCLPQCLSLLMSDAHRAVFHYELGIFYF